MAFKYAVKFLCGNAGSGLVARGRYFTVINVHTPTEDQIEFEKKFALPGQEPEQAGPISNIFSTVLGPDEVLEIDCRDIFDHTNPISGTPFREGFVLITSKVELDITAVYTVEGLFGRIKSVHLDRVPPSPWR